MKTFSFFGITINLSKSKIGIGENIAIDNRDVEMNSKEDKDAAYQKGKADAYKDAMCKLLDKLNKKGK